MEEREELEGVVRMEVVVVVQQVPEEQLEAFRGSEKGQIHSCLPASI